MSEAPKIKEPLAADQSLDDVDRATRELRDFERLGRPVKLENNDASIQGNVRIVRKWLDRLKSTYSLARLLNYGRVRRHAVYWGSKRLFDICLSAALLICLFPLMLTIAYGIRRSSPGPILFRQERVGERLKVFTILKFRTMYEGVNSDPHVVLDEQTGQYRRPTFHEDYRVTKIGRVLRQWSLDELPQLINIFWGDMSFVGPRPLTTAESLDIPEEALVRYSVPAGVTGLAQVRNRSAIIDESRFDDDKEYVESPSHMQDFNIILMTVPKIRQE